MVQGVDDLAVLLAVEDHLVHLLGDYHGGELVDVAVLAGSLFFLFLFD